MPTFGRLLRLVAVLALVLLTLAPSWPVAPVSPLRATGPDDPGIIVDASAAPPVDEQTDAVLAAASARSQCVLTWGPALRVNADTNGDYIDPSIAVDAVGNIYAVWSRYGTPSGIFFSYRPVGGNWQPKTRVDNSTGQTTRPAIAVDPAGDAYAIWTDTRAGGSSSDLYASYRPAGGTWQANVKVNDTAGTIDNDYSALVVDSSGNAYAAWGDASGPSGATLIFFSYHPAGGAWQPHVKVNDDTTSYMHWHPSLALDGAGNLYAVWSDDRNVRMDIYSSYRPAGGSWQPNAIVNDVSDDHLREAASIAVDLAGNADAVWVDTRSGIPEVYSSHRPAGGAWGASSKVSDGSAIGFVLRTSVGVDAAGTAYAVWQDERGSGDFDPTVYFSFRPVGSAWSPNSAISPSGAAPWQLGVSIKVDAAGDAYATWYDSRSGRDDIYVSARPAGGQRWSANLLVNGPAGVAGQWDPVIAVDAADMAYALWWRDIGGGNSDLYFSYRPVDGAVWSTAEKVNDNPSPSVLYSPAIAVDAAGNAWAVWEDDRNGNPDIYFSYRPAGGPWQPNSKLNEDTDSSSQIMPAIAVDAAGNAYAVWDSRPLVSGDLDNIYFRYRLAGGHWLPSEKVNSEPGSIAPMAPAIAVDAGGNAQVVWRAYGASSLDLHAGYRPAWGTWQASVIVNDDMPADVRNFSLAVDPAGNAFAVWDNGSHDNKVHASYRPAGGAWGENSLVGDDVVNGAQTYPAVAVDAAGTAFVTWLDSRDGYRQNGIYATYGIVTPGSTIPRWMTNEKISDARFLGWVPKPRVAAGASGYVHVIWADLRNNPATTVPDIYSTMLFPYVQRVNAGGLSYSGSGNKTWCVDAWSFGDNPDSGRANTWGYNVASVAASTTATVTNTTDPLLYQTERRFTGPDSGGYRFRVPNGLYQVTLKFAETGCNAIGCRVFGITANAVSVSASYDIFKAAGGKNIAAPDLVFMTNVITGDLAIDFLAITNKPKINAIEVRRLAGRWVNTGGPATGSLPLWQADHAYTPGQWGYLGVHSSVVTTTHIIAGTNASLLVDERDGMIGYAFTLPDGKYKVTLSFSENQVAGAGLRVFDVRLQNVLVLSNFDIFATAGVRFKEVDKTFPATVSDGRLSIDFWSKTGAASIGSIKILSQ